MLARQVDHLSCPSLRWHGHRLLMIGMVVSALILCVPNAVLAQNQTPSDDTSNASELSALLVRELMQAAAIDDQLARVANAIENGLLSESSADNPMFSHLPPRVLRAQLQRSFDPVFLQTAVADSLVLDLSDTQITKILAFLRSEVGTYIVRQERERTLSESDADRETFLQSLQGLPPAEERIELLSHLDKAWQLTEANVDMMIDMQVALSVAIMPAMPESYRMSAESLAEIYNRQRDELMQHYRQDTLHSMLYIYDALSLDDIATYIAFAETSYGQEFVAAQNRALKKAMLEGSFLWGREISTELNRDKATGI